MRKQQGTLEAVGVAIVLLLRSFEIGLHGLFLFSRRRRQWLQFQLRPIDAFMNRHWMETESELKVHRIFSSSDIASVSAKKKFDPHRSMKNKENCVFLFILFIKEKSYQR